MSDIDYFYPPIPYEAISLTDILISKNQFAANALDCLAKIGQNIQEVGNLREIISLCKEKINEYDQRLANICKNLKGESDIYMFEELADKLLEAYASFQKYKKRIKKKNMNPELKEILKVQSRYYGRIKNTVDCFRNSGWLV